MSRSTVLCEENCAAEKVTADHVQITLAFGFESYLQYKFILWYKVVWNVTNPNKILIKFWIGVPVPLFAPWKHCSQCGLLYDSPFF